MRIPARTGPLALRARLWGWRCARLADERRRHYYDGPPEEYVRVDLEKLFTLLDLAYRGTGPLKVRRTDWPQTKFEMMAMIPDSFYVALP